MSLLDDICATTKSMTAEQADGKFQQKLGELFTSHPHLHARGVQEFIIKHYAGDVSYNVSGFTEKNNDDLFDTLIETMQFSKIAFFASLFPENVSSKNKKRPPTAGFKITSSCSELVIALNKCVPHYIRCIKPNENKKPREMDSKRTIHQIQYLGLIENIRVRRAGFAYRTTYESFLERFGILSKKTWPNPWSGAAKDGCIALLNDLNVDEKEWQLGKTKMFLRHPETLFQLEDLKERMFHNAASLIQRKFKQYKLKAYFIDLRNTVNDNLYQKKERRRLSLNKVYISDYLQYQKNAQLQSVMKEYNNEGGVVFSDEFYKPVRKFIGHRVDMLSLLVTPKSVNFIERVKDKKQFVTKIVHRIKIDEIASVSLSPLCDNFIVIHSKKQNTEEMFGEIVNKTELLSVLYDQYRKITNQALVINFSDSIQFTSNAKGKKKVAAFVKDKTEKAKLAVLSGSSTKWTVTIATGLPADSKPKPVEVKQKKQIKTTQSNQQKPKEQESNNHMGLGVMESIPTQQDRPKRPPPNLPKKKESKPQAKALFDYDATASDELTIKEGDIINIVEKSESGWWEGEINGKVGLFPGNYVELLN
jgi:myosin I